MLPKKEALPAKDRQKNLHIFCPKRGYFGFLVHVKDTEYKFEAARTWSPLKTWKEALETWKEGQKTISFSHYFENKFSDLNCVQIDYNGKDYGIYRRGHKLGVIAFTEGQWAVTASSGQIHRFNRQWDAIALLLNEAKLEVAA